MKRALPVAVPLLVYAALCALFIPYGQPNPDEGFYLGSAQGMAAGGVLYQDFGYTQMPLLPALHSVLLRPFGFGLFQVRTANALWGLLSLAAVLWTLRRRAPMDALLGGLLITTSFIAMSFTAMAKSLAASGALLTLAAAVLLSEVPFRKKLWLFALAASAAVACRLTVGPAVVVLCIGLGLQRGKKLDVLAAFGATFAVGVLLCLPFILAAPRNFFFWNLGYHFASEVQRGRLASSAGMFFAAPGPLVVAALGVYFGRRERGPAFWIALAGLLGLLAQHALPVAYAEYVTPFLGLAVIGGVLNLPESWRTWKAAAALVALGPLALLGARPSPPDFQLPTKLARAAAHLRERVPPGGLVLSTSAIVPIAADRAVLPPLQNSPFALTTQMSDDEARAHALTTPNLLAQELDAHRVAAVVVFYKRPLLNFGWSVPTYTPTKPEELRPLTERISSAHFDTTYKDDLFMIMLPKQ